jgi:V8-like Glu-specific endopeptidase
MPASGWQACWKPLLCLMQAARAAVLDRCQLRRDPASSCSLHLCLLAPPAKADRPRLPALAPRRTAKLVDAAAAPARAALRLSSIGLLYIASERSQMARVLNSTLEAAKKAGLSTQLGKGSLGVDGSELKPTTGRKLKYIFGADGRVQTSSLATTYPWRTVGQINMQGSDGNTYTCSGATVGPRAVLTAGHCVHSGPGGSGWYNVQFSAGRSCRTCNPYGGPWPPAV